MRGGWNRRGRIPAPVAALRNGGASWGDQQRWQAIPHSLLEQVRQSPSMRASTWPAQVSTRPPTSGTSFARPAFDQRQEARPSDAYPGRAIDFGNKRGILSASPPQGCQVSVLPADSGSTRLLAWPERVFPLQCLVI